MILAIGRSKGFTLIEVMVSIAILSFGLILILQGFAYSANVLRISRNNLEATLLTEEKMAETEIMLKQTKDSLFSGFNGESKSNNIEFKWKTELTIDEEYEDLNKVLATISWKEGRRKGTVPIFTYLRTPTR